MFLNRQLTCKEGGKKKGINCQFTILIFFGLNIHSIDFFFLKIKKADVHIYSFEKGKFIDINRFVTNNSWTLSRSIEFSTKGSGQVIITTKL